MNVKNELIDYGKSGSGITREIRIESDRVDKRFVWIHIGQEYALVKADELYRAITNATNI